MKREGKRAIYIDPPFFVANYQFASDRKTITQHNTHFFAATDFFRACCCRCFSLFQYVLKEGGRNVQAVFHPFPTSDNYMTRKYEEIPNEKKKSVNEHLEVTTSTLPSKSLLILKSKHNIQDSLEFLVLSSFLV